MKSTEEHHPRLSGSGTPLHNPHSTVDETPSGGKRATDNQGPSPNSQEPINPRLLSRVDWGPRSATQSPDPDSGNLPQGSSPDTRAPRVGDISNPPDTVVQFHESTSTLPTGPSPQTQEPENPSLPSSASNPYSDAATLPTLPATKQRPGCRIPPQVLSPRAGPERALSHPPEKREIDEVIPGHIADPFALHRVPKRIETAFRNWEYIPYGLLTLEALENQNELFRLSPRDGPGPEDTIETEEWCEASFTAVQLMRKYRGSDRADRLNAHHAIVADLTSQYGWPVARKYDISVRRKAVLDPRHDLATRDVTQLILTFGDVQKSGQLLANSWSSSTDDRPSVPVSGNPNWGGAGKRSRAPDEGGIRPGKPPRWAKRSRRERSGCTQPIREATITSVGELGAQGVVSQASTSGQTSHTSVVEEKQPPTEGSRPIRPPVTLEMLTTLKDSLQLDSGYDACVWAMAACAFWGMMRMGEATVTNRKAFSPLHHPTRGSFIQGYDSKGTPYARIDLPKAKTAEPGEKQSVWLTQQGVLCPIAAVQNMARVTPAAKDHPLFSWRDGASDDIHPLVTKAAMNRVDEILQKHGWRSESGYSFSTGGALRYLDLGVDSEVVRRVGRWESLDQWQRVVASRSTAGSSGTSLHA